MGRIGTFRGASTALLGLLLVGFALAPSATALSPTSALRLDVSEAAVVDDAVSEAIANLQAVYEATYLVDGQSTIGAAVEILTADQDFTASGTASAQEFASSIVDEHSQVTQSDSGVTIDQVSVEQVGVAELSPEPGGDVAALVDLRVSRHIAEDDVDWIEVIPHEIVVDVATGDIESLVPHDLQYQLDQASPEQVSPPRLMIVPEPTATTAVAPAGMTATSRQKVADYATKWALGHNKSYVKYSVDCTNFVSQAMYAGGWKEVAHPIPDYKWDNAWWYGGIPTNSWTWSGAENFYRMTKALKRTTTAKYVSDLRLGDLLQYKNKSSSTMTHSMVVTKKVGTNIYLSYHTTDTLNKPFSALSSLNVYWFGHHV